MRPVIFISGYTLPIFNTSLADQCLCVTCLIRISAFDSHLHTTSQNKPESTSTHHKTSYIAHVEVTYHFETRLKAQVAFMGMKRNRDILLQIAAAGYLSPKLALKPCLGALSKSLPPLHALLQAANSMSHTVQLHVHLRTGKNMIQDNLLKS